jgi:hypothetical protein
MRKDNALGKRLFHADKVRNSEVSSVMICYGLREFRGKSYEW